MKATAKGNKQPITTMRLLVDGRPFTVRTRRGTARATARVTRDIRPDTLFMPFHWPNEGSANRLTNSALDPISRMPEFKVCAARVDRDGDRDSDD